MSEKPFQLRINLPTTVASKWLMRCVAYLGWEWYYKFTTSERAQIRSFVKRKVSATIIIRDEGEIT